MADTRDLAILGEDLDIHELPSNNSEVHKYVRVHSHNVEERTKHAVTETPSEIQSTVEEVESDQPTPKKPRSRVLSRLSQHFKRSSGSDPPSQIPKSLPDTSSLSKACNTILRPLGRKPPPIFYKFNDLPTEIRLQIWEAAIIPKVHELHPCSRLYNERMTFRSNSSGTPAIFHANRQSREVALRNYQLMSYEPPRSLGKGVLRFYFSPEYDILFLNSLMGLFIMFMLLEEEEYYTGAGVMKGWQRVAFDAERAQLINLLSGVAGNAPQPRFKAVFPQLKEMIIAFDYDKKGKTKFRTSVWPGENGTSLSSLSTSRLLAFGLARNADDEDDDGQPGDDTIEGVNDLDADGDDLQAAVDTRNAIVDTIYKPIKEYLSNDYADGMPDIKLAWVKRKRYIRGDLRYGFRKGLTLINCRPRWIFRRL